jgi:hypothetical protein
MKYYGRLVALLVILTGSFTIAMNGYFPSRADATTMGLQPSVIIAISSDDPQPTPNFSPDPTSGSSGSLSDNSSGAGNSPGIDLSPPLITRDDIEKALMCGLSAAKLRLPDEDLKNAIDTVLTGRSIVEVRNNLVAMFVKLGIGFAPYGECAAPYLQPPPAE